MARRRVRCVFSESLKVQTLGVAEVLPGMVPGRTGAWRAVSRVLRSSLQACAGILGDLLLIVFPGDCRVCDGPLLFVAGSGSAPVCRRCIAAVNPQKGLLCIGCGEALGMESERFASQLSDGVRCAMCRLAPPDFERAAAFAVYEGETRRLIHLLKYDGVRTVAPALGRLLAITIEALIAPGSVILLLAVPLFPAKQRARGYNQAELLADEAHRTMRQKLSKLCFEPAHRVLRRVRETESQFALSAVGRRRNLRGAFHVSDPKRVAGREVLLVDDIYTTGATARECARVLRKAGAAKVWVATLGRAQTEGIALWTADRSGQQARFTGSSYLQDRASLV